MVGSPAYNVCAEEEDGRERAGIPQQAGQSDLQGDNAHDYPFRERFVAHELRNLQLTSYGYFKIENLSQIEHSTE